MSARSLEVLVTAAYTGTLEICGGTALDLLVDADTLLFRAARATCCAFLERKLEASNACSVLIAPLAGGINNGDVQALLEAAQKCARHGFAEAAASAAFLALSADALVALLGGDDVRVESEDEVYDAAARWLQHDSAARRGVPDVLFRVMSKGVRLPRVTARCFGERVMPDLMNANASADCQRLCQEVGSYFATPDAEKAQKALLLQLSSAKPRVKFFPDKLYVLGSPHRSVISWNGEAWDTDEVPDLPGVRTFAAAAWLRGKLYIIGGRVDDGDPSKQCLCWDPSNPGAWQQVADMSIERMGHAVAVLDEKLYAIGGNGRGNDGDLSSAERYDPVTDTWEDIAAMQEPRYGAKATVLNGKLYIAGDYNTIERYDAATNSWQDVGGQLPFREFGGVAAMDNKLWVAGGNNNRVGQADEAVLEMNVYDPEAGDAFVTKAGMNTGRDLIALVVLDGNMFAIEHHEIMLEKYDPAANTWNVVPAMNLPETRFGGCACVREREFR